MELIAHLVGDYVLQNHAMATRKTASSKWAAIHVAFYTLPFFLLMLSPIDGFSLPWSSAALAIIASTHFAIDRYGIARRWVAFYGIGVPSRFTGPIEAAPPFLATWLLIIVDNTFHLAINRLAFCL